MLMNSVCSVTFIKASGISHVHGTVGGCGAVLDTMNGQQLCTHGVVWLTSLWCSDQELGPLNAHMLSTLPHGVEIVIGLHVPLLLDHSCWFGCVGGQPTVCWGTAGAAMVGTAIVGAAMVGTAIVGMAMMGTTTAGTAMVGATMAGTATAGTTWQVQLVGAASGHSHGGHCHGGHRHDRHRHGGHRHRG